MIIKRKLFTITVDKSLTYSVAADSLDEAIRIMYNWKPICNITSIQQTSDCVLTKEDVQ